MKTKLALAALGTALLATPALGADDGSWFETFAECDRALSRADPVNKNYTCLYDLATDGYVVRIALENKKRSTKTAARQTR